MGKTYQEFAPSLVGDTVVEVRGRVSVRDDGVNLHAYSIVTVDTSAIGASGPLVISLADHRATTDVVKSLNDVLIRHSGDSEVRLRLIKGSSARMFEIPYPVTVTSDLYGELKSLLGPGCLG
jgi:DNA polymerase-3 subunit alpha